MTRLTTFGRRCFAAALAAFGIMNFVYGDFVAGRAPAWPEALPGRLAWAFASGAGFVLVSKTLESSGELFDLAPVLVGWIPTALLATLTASLLWRNR